MPNPLGTLPGASMGQTPGRQARRPQRPAGQQPAGGQTQQPAGQAPTFAEMQQQGRARPAPPPVAPPLTQTTTNGAQQGQSPLRGLAGYSGRPDPVAGQLQGAVSNALQSPSRYDLPQVQQVRDSLTADLGNQFGQIRERTNEDLARRGLAASTFGANDLHDVDSAQSRALSDMNAQLTQNYAATQAQDLSASLGAGQNYQNALNANQINQGNLGIAQQNANTSQEGTRGNIALGQAGLAQSGSQFDRSLAQSGSQFGQTLAEQQAGRLQQGQQFGQQFGEGARQFDIQQQLASQLGLGNLNLNRDQLAQQGSQFGQSLAEQQAGRLQSGEQFGQSLGEQRAGREQQGQQFNIQQALASQLGLGNLANQQQQTANQQQQFGATLAEQQAGRQQQGQQFTQSQQQQGHQFDLQQALASQLGLGNLENQRTQTQNQASQFNASQQQQRDQFGRTLEEQIASRNQNANQFTTGQNQQNQQFQQSQLMQYVQAALQSGTPIPQDILARLGLNNWTPQTPPNGQPPAGQPPVTGGGSPPGNGDVPAAYGQTFDPYASRYSQRGWT